MWGLPWGIILLLPASWLLFQNKGRKIAKDLGLSRRGLLWYIFFLLAGGFVTLKAATFYLNLGGIVALAFALRLVWRLSARERLRALLIALVSGFICFTFQTGQLWWLVRLPLATEWLLAFISGMLAAAFSLALAPAVAGLISGLLIGYAAALAYVSSGLIAVEFGSLACVNLIVLALFFCLLTLRLLRLLLPEPLSGKSW